LAWIIDFGGRPKESAQGDVFRYCPISSAVVGRRSRKEFRGVRRERMLRVVSDKAVRIRRTSVRGCMLARLTMMIFPVLEAQDWR